MEVTPGSIHLLMTPNPTETLRMLVVSRDPSVVRLLWSIAETNSWHLETSANGWEAMERVQSDVAPHLLLLDIPRGQTERSNPAGCQGCAVPALQRRTTGIPDPKTSGVVERRQGSGDSERRHRITGRG